MDGALGNAAVYCSACGIALSTGARFCPACGVAVTHADPPIAASPLAPPVQPAPGPRARSGSNLGLWFRRIERAASLRVIAISAVGAAIVGALAGTIAKVLEGPVAVIVFILFWLGAAMNDDVVLRCPYCRKRVKVGAEACHHCGRVVVNN